MARKPIHPKVKAGAGTAGAAAAIVSLAAYVGFDLPLAVAESIVVIAAFVGGYLKSA